MGLERLFFPRRRKWRRFLDQVAPLELRRIEQRGHVGLRGLDAAVGEALVGDRRGVVLVAQPGEVVPELVDDQVVGETRIGRRRRVQPEDPAAAVLPFVDQDQDKIVRHGRRRIAPRSVVERQDVALGIEAVVPRAERGIPKHSRPRPRNPGMIGRCPDGAHVEIALARTVGLETEQRVRCPPRVGEKLLLLGRRVAIAEDRQIDLDRGGAVVDQRDPFRGRGGRTIDKS